MTSKKFIATSMAAFAASASFALNYFCGQPDNSQREYKWSTCNWGSEIQFASADLSEDDAYTFVKTICENVDNVRHNIFQQTLIMGYDEKSIILCV